MAFKSISNKRTHIVEELRPFFSINCAYLSWLYLRLGMRSSLARLYSEIETFRFRAIQDTQLTVTKMEQSRSEYRAGLLWMADISKELDPDQFKRLDKFRDVRNHFFSYLLTSLIASIVKSFK